MATLELLNVTSSSHSSTNYGIADPALVREAIRAVSEPASQPQHEMPVDLFDLLVG